MSTETLFIQWLLAERRRYQDRAGAPTLADIRAHGVSRCEIREYLRDTGWACDALDVGVCRTRGQWQAGPPTWSHPDHAPALDLRNDDITIAELAELEQRSPWAVLADVSSYGAEREIYHGDTLVALARGRLLQRVSDGATFDTCAE